MVPLVERYRDRLPVGPQTPVVTLGEGGTPLLRADRLSERLGIRLWLKFDGANPTGSFKDRGMTVAISKALEEGAQAVVCASTGNTAASAAAYAARAGLPAVVLQPAGAVALGKLSQALALGARLLEVRGSFDEALTAARELARRGVELRVSTRLERAEAESVTLSDGERIPTHTLVWTAGVRPNPLLAQLGLPLDERGRVTVDETLRVKGTENVWALGDCARVPNMATPGAVDPPTSQHALRQARRVARNLGGEIRPYRYRMLGQVATLGRHKGIAELPGVRLRGFLGWFVTRTYHLYQLPLLSRKLRVLVDWTTALFFRRDIAELGALGHPRGLGDD